jgi:hypothetical protein
MSCWRPSNASSRVSGPSGRGDGVALTGVCLLSNLQFLQFRLEGRPVDRRGQVRCRGATVPGPVEVRCFVLHDRLPSACTLATIGIQTG